MPDPKVAMTHPGIPGSLSYVTMVQYTEVWQPKGWALVTPTEETLDLVRTYTGALADRPLASQVEPGDLYFADEGGVYRSDGGNWTTLNVGTGGGEPGETTVEQVFLFDGWIRGGKPNTNYATIPYAQGGAP